MEKGLMVNKTRNEYVKGVPYFCQGQKIKEYPYLNQDKKTEVLIIGGGVDGAIANYYLAPYFKVMLVDKSRFGMGCTSCATVLLEYQLDSYAKDLTKYLTEEEIVQVYRMGLDGICLLDEFIGEVGNGCHYAKRPTLLYTKTKSGVKDIKEEYEFRKKHGFKVKYYEEDNHPFSFAIKAGLYASDGGAEVNPYLYTKQLLESACNQQALFENTEIVSIYKEQEHFVAVTNYHHKIICDKIIFATGFNFELVEDTTLCSRTVSYSIVTNPLPNLRIYKNTLVQDDEDPYHYLRLLEDGRIIFGGEDTTYNGKEIKDNKANKKYLALLNDLKEMFPKYAGDIKIDYAFCGCFGSTDNNLGLIGETSTKNIYSLISCGANGIINAIVGAQMLKDIFYQKDNPLVKLFSPLREK